MTYLNKPLINMNELMAVIKVNIQWKPVKVTPLKVNNRFTSTADVGPVFSALYFSNLNPDNVNHLRP